MPSINIFNNLKSKSAPVAKPSPSPSPSLSYKAKPSFFHLPGEIRNQIYAYAVYPYTTDITIVHATKLEHLGASTLYHSLFRTSRQSRSELLSYLCATKTFTIMHMETANVFFTCIGPAVREIKTLCVVISARDIVHTGGFLESMKLFFGFMELASSLRELRIHGLKSMEANGIEGAHLRFLEGLAEVESRGVFVERD